MIVSMIETKGDSNRNCLMKGEEEEENREDSNSRCRGVLSFLTCLRKRYLTTMTRYCLRRQSEGEHFPLLLEKAAENVALNRRICWEMCPMIERIG